MSEPTDRGGTPERTAGRGSIAARVVLLVVLATAIALVLAQSAGAVHLSFLGV